MQTLKSLSSRRRDVLATRVMVFFFFLAPLLLSPSLAAQTRVARDGAKREPQESAEWRRATKEDCEAETKRQYKEMAESGWCCDPPITMGFAMFSFDKNEKLNGYGESPCGYVKISDPRQFRSVFKVWKHGREIETMDEEWFNRAICRNIMETIYHDKNGRVLKRPIERRVSPKPEWTECKR